MLETIGPDNINGVMINIRNEKYLIEMEYVKEIYIPGEKIVPIPLTNKSILGIIDVRGIIYPIIFLKRVIYKEDYSYDLDAQSKVLLLELSNLNVAVLVDSVDGVKNIPFSVFGNQKTIVETNLEYNFIKRVGNINNKPFIVLNLEALVKSFMGDIEIKPIELIQPSLQKITYPKGKPKIVSETQVKTIELSPKMTKSYIKNKKISEDISLSGEQQDILMEVGNIGSGNAVTALSRLIKKKINVDLTDVGLISYDELAKQFGGPDNKVCGIFCHINKPSNSTILQIFEAKALLQIVSDLAGKESKILVDKVEKKSDLDSYAISTIIEIGNIMAGHYASAIADLLGTKIITDVPEFTMSKAEALSEFLSAELKSLSKYIIIIKTSIEIIDLKLNGAFFFIPDIEFLKLFFNKLGIKKNLDEIKVESSEGTISDLEKIKLSEIQRDALQEIGNIGAGNAANALALMINNRVDINIPSVEMVELDKYAMKLSKKNEKLLVAWSNIVGITKATVLTTFNVKDIVNLTSIIVDDEKKKLIDLRKKINKIEDFPEIYRSAMSELGHILASHYISAIGDLLGMRLMTEPPDMSIDTGQQLFNILKDEIGILRKLSLVITTNIIITDFKITGTFLYIPDLETIQELLDALMNFYK